MDETCINCRFHDEGNMECHRHAPVDRGRFDFYYGELLQTIAESLVIMAKILDPEEYFGKDHALYTEVTEAYQRGLWPMVKETNWCGEFEPKRQSSKVMIE